MSDVELGPPLEAAVEEFREWWRQRQKALDIAQKVNSPLFHYTDASGLAGIIKNQNIWFTNIFHLNDPSELAYGIEIARAALRTEWQAADKAIKFFCERLEEMLLKGVGNVLGFYVASFSKSPDDLGQWRAYADNGRGFAIGLAPRLFHIREMDNPKPHELVFVSDVIYDRNIAEERQRETIKRATEIIEKEIKKGSIGSEGQGRKFLTQMSIYIIAPILWNSITTKHSSYINEMETRLIIVNDLQKLADHIEFRSRGSNLIPFIRSPMPVRDAGSITEIVIGPSASDPEAEDAVMSLLISCGLSPDTPIRRSEIPYRAHP